MTRSPRETRLAYSTFAALLIYVPVETVYSWKDGLTDPFYVVDVIAMVLMLAGAIVSLRARPLPAPGLMTVGWAWAGANFWRSMFDRLKLLERGGQLDFGSLELRFVCAETVIALICVGVGVMLILESREASP